MILEREYLPKEHRERQAAIIRAYARGVDIPVSLLFDDPDLDAALITYGVLTQGKAEVLHLLGQITKAVEDEQRRQERSTYIPLDDAL